MLGLKRCQFDIRFIYSKQNTQTHTQTLHVKKGELNTHHTNHTHNINNNNRTLKIQKTTINVFTV